MSYSKTRRNLDILLPHGEFILKVCCERECTGRGSLWMAPAASAAGAAACRVRQSVPTSPPPPPPHPPVASSQSPSGLRPAHAAGPRPPSPLLHTPTSHTLPCFPPGLRRVGGAHACRPRRRGALAGEGRACGVQVRRAGGVVRRGQCPSPLQRSHWSYRFRPATGHPMPACTNVCACATLPPHLAAHPRRSQPPCSGGRCLLSFQPASHLSNHREPVGAGAAGASPNSTLRSPALPIHS